jgi:hypothetical protein
VKKPVSKFCLSNANLQRYTSGLEVEVFQTILHKKYFVNGGALHVESS